MKTKEGLKTLNHWGVWIDNHNPITGVISNNTAQWLHEESMYDSIDLDWEDHINDCAQCENDQWCDIVEHWEGSTTFLIGDWILDTNTRLYEPDKKSEYSGIYRVDSNVTQIVWSKYTKMVTLCSPCYPGQGDLDSIGNWVAYDLPPKLY